MCDEVIDLNPLRIPVLGPPAGTDAYFEITVVKAGSSLDISGDTFEAIVYARDVAYTGTATVSGGKVICAWTGAQTLAIGPGTYQWKLVWNRAGRVFNLLQHTFQVTKNAE